MRSVYTVLLVLSILIVAGCRNPITNPAPLLLDTELDYGPDEYRQGYKDGCESALAAYGNSYQKTVFDLSKTAEYQNNRVYNQVWKDSWAFCYQWIFVQNFQDKNSLHNTPF